MRLRCGGSLLMFHYAFTAESDGKIVLKIDQHFGEVMGIFIFHQIKYTYIKYTYKVSVCFHETRCICYSKVVKSVIS